MVNEKLYVDYVRIIVNLNILIVILEKISWNSVEIFDVNYLLYYKIVFIC